MSADVPATEFKRFPDIYPTLHISSKFLDEALLDAPDPETANQVRSAFSRDPYPIPGTKLLPPPFNQISPFLLWLFGCLHVLESIRLVRPWVPWGQTGVFFDCSGFSGLFGRHWASLWGGHPYIGGEGPDELRWLNRHMPDATAFFMGRPLSVPIESLSVRLITSHLALNQIEPEWMDHYLMELSRICATEGHLVLSALTCENDKERAAFSGAFKDCLSHTLSFCKKEFEVPDMESPLNVLPEKLLEARLSREFKIVQKSGHKSLRIWILQRR